MKPLELLLIILLALGAVQGLIYGIILWKSKGINAIAKRFLASVLFFFSYRLIVELLKFFDIGFYDAWYHILLEYNWIYGALIFFFVKANVTPNFKLNIKQDWIHFSPVLIEFIWSNFIKSQNFFWDGTRESLSWLGYYGYIVWMHYPTMYIISALLVIYYTFKAEKLLNPNENEYFEIIEEKTIWIKRLLKILRWFSILVIITVLTDLFFFNYAFNRWYHYPLFIGMALITYWLGIEGFGKRNEIIIKTKTVLSSKEKEQLKTIADKLKRLMVDDKLFRNTDLTLSSLSKHLDVKSYLITKCL
ncbi:AraC family transcriptional regulator, partial [Psychroserpens sp.]|uniref:AraC family transcriptional regulator n=1 Tax=Psychroserpens sp. TaxID=2020870 RepID=UPI00385A495F